MDIEEHHDSIVEDGEKRGRNVSGLGVLLKREREKKCLSLQQVAEMTRLRSHMIEALENEDWSGLPAPPFVRGFIRSYAKAIHLDERSILDLYNKVAPATEESLRPLVEIPTRARKKRFFLILMLGAVAAMIYVWRGYSPSDKVPGPEEGERQVVQSRSADAIGMKSEAPKSVKEDDQPAQVRDSETTQPRSVASSGERPGPGGSSMPGESRARHSGEEGAGGSVTESERTPMPYELTGIVSVRTWIEMRIDGQEPKEYMFQPGHRHQWGAKKGFLIVIGNAGGIELDLNGKKMANLGRLGQVVRLRLPEDFKEAGEED